MSHSYRTIYNWPEERQRKFYNWCYWDNAFNEEEVDSIVKYMDSQELERGTTIGQKKQKVDVNNKTEIISTEPKDPKDWQRPNERVRKSDVKFINFDLNTFNYNM